MTEVKMVKLAASDKTEFSVPVEVANQSVLLKNMLEDVGDAEDSAIPLPNVSAKILEKVIEYATKHKDDPSPDPDAEPKPSSCEDMDDWDKKFMDVEMAQQFEIILAANYLDMKNLLDTGCKTIARLYIKDKSEDEIRKAFNMPKDTSEEEEAAIRKENEWAEDKS